MRRRGSRGPGAGEGPYGPQGGEGREEYNYAMIMERVRDGEKKSWEGKAGWLCGTKEGKKKGSRK